MKHILLILAAAVLITSCKEYTESSHMQQMAQMKDSIFKTYPTVVAVSMKIEDKTLLIVALGDRHLYKADDIKRKKVAHELAQMTIRLFGKETELKDEKLIVTGNERNDQADPKDGIATTVSLDSLIKTMK